MTTSAEARRVSTATLAGVTASGAWIMLALLRPTTTWHLAPALVVLAPPWTAEHRGDQRQRWTAIGITLALATTAVLHSQSLLRGPALIGPNATTEAVIAIMAATVARLLPAMFRRPSTHRR